MGEDIQQIQACPHGGQTCLFGHDSPHGRVFTNAWACGAIGGILGGVLGVILVVSAAMSFGRPPGPAAGWTHGSVFPFIVYPASAFLGFLPGVVLGIAFARRRQGRRIMILPCDDARLAYWKGLDRNGWRCLRGLYLNGAQITDTGLEHLKELTDLRRLELSDTAIGSIGLESLKGLTKLRSLNLARTKVSDAGLQHLKRLTNLKSLDLKQTQVTSEGVEKLQEALPDCRIEH
jgi:hypothetical protein